MIKFFILTVFSLFSTAPKPIVSGKAHFLGNMHYALAATSQEIILSNL